MTDQLGLALVQFSDSVGCHRVELFLAFLQDHREQGFNWQTTVINLQLISIKNKLLYYQGEGFNKSATNPWYFYRMTNVNMATILKFEGNYLFETVL